MSYPKKMYRDKPILNDRNSLYISLALIFLACMVNAFVLKAQVNSVSSKIDNLTAKVHTDTTYVIDQSFEDSVYCAGYTDGVKKTVEFVLTHPYYEKSKIFDAVK